MPYHEGKKVKFKRRTAGWNPGEWETGRVGGRGKHGRWGVLKGCEPVEIGGGGGRYATKLNISQSTKGLY